MFYCFSCFNDIVKLQQSYNITSKNANVELIMGAARNVYILTSIMRHFYLFTAHTNYRLIFENQFKDCSSQLQIVGAAQNVFLIKVNG